MYIHYQQLIKETPERLLKLAQKEKDTMVLKRLQILRLLKSGLATTMEEAAGLVGMSPAQARRLWSDYKRGGLEIALTRLKPGRKSRLKHSNAESYIQTRVVSGHFRSLKEVQQYLQTKYQVAYTLAGVWHLLMSLDLQIMPKKAKRRYKTKHKPLS